MMKNQSRKAHKLKKLKILMKIWFKKRIIREIGIKIRPVNKNKILKNK